MAFYVAFLIHNTFAEGARALFARVIPGSVLNENNMLICFPKNHL